MSKGKDKCVDQGGQPERSAVTRQPERSGDHPRDSAMVKGKVKRVAQGGQPERSGATSQHAQ